MPDLRRGPAAWALVLDADAVTGGPSRHSAAAENRGPAREPRGAGNGGAARAGRRRPRHRRHRCDPPLIRFRASGGRGGPRLHDIVVTGVHRGGLLSERAIAEHLVFQAGRPAVIVPVAHGCSVQCERIAVGWDSSRVAASALGDAMPLIRRARDVSLVTACEEQQIAASLSEHDLIEALSRRGVAARHEMCQPGRLRGRRGVQPVCAAERTSR